MYQLVISDKTGTDLLIKPHFIVKGNVTYNNLISFIFETFELGGENYSDYITMYSLITWQKYEGNEADSYQTILTVLDNEIQKWH